MPGGAGLTCPRADAQGGVLWTGGSGELWGFGSAEDAWVKKGPQH